MALGLERRTSVYMPTSASADALTTPDLTDPYYAVEHVARLLFLAVDTIRDLTYQPGFPSPIKAGRRWLWQREEVLTWLGTQRRYSPDDRRRLSAPVPTPEYRAAPLSDAAKGLKPYQPRAPRPMAA